MLLVLSMFFICNIISAFATHFTVVLVARILPAFLHPVYVSLAFSVASASVKPQDIPKAVSKVMIGVSAGMVLGVPIVSYIAGITSLQVAMLSFAFVNAIALIATVLFIPSMPVKERLTYGEQLVILKEANVWISIAGVVFLNGAVFGVYSYLAEYLEKITSLSIGMISMMLLFYGLANIVGNVIAGKLLGSQANKFVISFPFLLIGVYGALFFLGSITLPMAVIILDLGNFRRCRRQYQSILDHFRSASCAGLCQWVISGGDKFGYQYRCSSMRIFHFPNGDTIYYVWWYFILVAQYSLYFMASRKSKEGADPSKSGIAKF